MINGKRILGLILARGGSKGLPDKNVRRIANKPLIEWTVEAGLHSRYIDDLLLSTDSQLIADIAIMAGAKAPFLRPSEFAKDTSPSIDAILHAVNWVEEHWGQYEYLVLLEPTSPLREALDIDAAIEALENDNDAESIVGVCKTEAIHPAFFCYIREGRLAPYSGSFEVKRRQEIEDLFFFEGSVYVSHISSLKTRKAFYHDKTIPYIVPKWKSFEIDDIIDFIIVERLLELRIQGSENLK